MAEPLAHAASHDHEHKPHGWRRWVYATNHKDIGTMYLIFACTMFFIGGGMAMLIRLELFKPGCSFGSAVLQLRMTTNARPDHDLRAPGDARRATGLANWIDSDAIGAPDMALPRPQQLQFLILPFAFHAAAVVAVSCPAGRPGRLDHMYPPLVRQRGILPDADLLHPPDGRLLDPRRHQRHPSPS